MLIHELSQPAKKINEDLKSFLGLNNPVVAQAWDQIGGELMQDLAARFTKDPRYANMPLAQRKQAMAADSGIQQTATQKYNEWNQYIAGLQAKSPTPLGDQQIQAAFLNWVNQSLFNNKFASLDSTAKADAQKYIDGFLRYQNTPEPKKSQMQKEHLQLLLADETARMIQVATDLNRAQAATSQATTAGPQKTTAGATPTVSVGGEPQNPNDPATARLMALAKSQGKI